MCEDVDSRVVLSRLLYQASVSLILFQIEDQALFYIYLNDLASFFLVFRHNSFMDLVGYGVWRV